MLQFIRIEREGSGVMVRKFIETNAFTKRWNEMGLSDDDLLGLQNHIMKNTNAGNVIVGTGGARKIRYGLPQKGKSGGARVIYVDMIVRQLTKALKGER